MRYIAADFGAGSGRVMVGTVTPGSIQTEEVYRFPNQPVRLGKTLYWDFPALFHGLVTGLRKAFITYDDIFSIGVDTWGVDFGLLDKQGRLLSNPVCYRDERTAGILEKVFGVIPREALYARTGNQMMEINTAFQLYSMVLNEDPLLPVADKLLFMPDLFNYFLTGIAVNEYTISTTSQLLHPREQDWDPRLFKLLGIPSRLMQSVVPSGTILGDLLPGIVPETNGKPVKVVAVGAHDTASALASLRPEDDEWAFISSGTWSLMGIKVKEPILSPLAMELDFTNEGTVDGEIRFLKNITGLWILQRVMKELEAEGISADYDAMIEAAGVSSLETILDVDHPGFHNPPDMREAIGTYCAATAQQAPGNPGEYMRCIVRSLATKYAEVRRQLELISGRKIGTIYIMGGGSRNRLLNRMTEELTACRVITGEVEATAMGNIRVQAEANGESVY